MNLTANKGERKELLAAVDSFFGDKGELPNNFLLGESSNLDNMDEEVGVKQFEKDDSDVCFKNALAMLPELEAFYATSKKASFN